MYTTGEVVTFSFCLSNCREDEVPHSITTVTSLRRTKAIFHEGNFAAFFGDKDVVDVVHVRARVCGAIEDLYQSGPPSLQIHTQQEDIQVPSEPVAFPTSPTDKVKVVPPSHDGHLAVCAQNMDVEVESSRTEIVNPLDDGHSSVRMEILELL